MFRHELIKTLPIFTIALLFVVILLNNNQVIDATTGLVYNEVSDVKINACPNSVAPFTWTTVKTYNTGLPAGNNAIISELMIAGNKTTPPHTTAFLYFTFNKTGTNSEIGIQNYLYNIKSYGSPEPSSYQVNRQLFIGLDSNAPANANYTVYSCSYGGASHPNLAVNTVIANGLNQTAFVSNSTTGYVGNTTVTIGSIQTSFPQGNNIILVSIPQFGTAGTNGVPSVTQAVLQGGIKLINKNNDTLASNVFYKKGIVRTNENAYHFVFIDKNAPANEKYSVTYKGYRSQTGSSTKTSILVLQANDVYYNNGTITSIGTTHTTTNTINLNTPANKKLVYIDTSEYNDTASGTKPTQIKGNTTGFIYPDDYGYRLSVSGAVKTAEHYNQTAVQSFQGTGQSYCTNQTNCEYFFSGGIVYGSTTNPALPTVTIDQKANQTGLKTISHLGVFQIGDQINAPSINVTTVSQTSLFTSWTKPTTGSVVGYKLERSPDSVSWGTIGTSLPNKNYTDTGLTPNTLYYYRVSGYDGGSYGLTSISSGMTCCASQSGGGGGGGGGVPSSPTSIFDLFQPATSTIMIDNLFLKMTAGQTINSALHLKWNNVGNLTVGSIIVKENPTWFGFVATPITISGASNGVSSGDLGFTLVLPNAYCENGITSNCVEKKVYNIDVTIQGILNGATFTTSGVIRLDLTNTFIPATYTIFIAFALAILFIIGYGISHMKKRKKYPFLKGLNKLK